MRYTVTVEIDMPGKGAQVSGILDVSVSANDEEHAKDKAREFLGSEADFGGIIEPKILNVTGPRRPAELADCVQIAAEDWLREPDVQTWLDNRANGVARLFCGDVFTVYDHGEGPHSPISSPENAMPRWLWDEIEKILKEKHVDYCVVRLMNVEEP